MIKPQYGVKCLRLGFERYRAYSKLPISIEVSQTTVSFYVEKPSTPKGKNARVSNHHPNLQHYADNGRQPWFNDNVSIEFIPPKSEEDKKRFRARVYQNSIGTIQPFDVTAYQYNSNLIDPTDIVTIFKAIIVFLNGGGYSDPFAGTTKEAKVLPRHSNIKPHKSTTSSPTPPSTPSTSSTITCSKKNNLLNDKLLNEMAIYCLKGCISLTENKQYKTNRNMKRRIKLTESSLHRIIKESVRRVLNEIGDTKKGQYALGALQARKNRGLAPSSDGFDRSVGKYASDQRKKVLGHDNAFVKDDNFIYGIHDINPLMDMYDLGYSDYESLYDEEDFPKIARGRLERMNR